MAPGCWFWAPSCFSSVAFSGFLLLYVSTHAGSPTGLEPGYKGTGLVPVLFSGKVLCPSSVRIEDGVGVGIVTEIAIPKQYGLVLLIFELYIDGIVCILL